MVISLQKTKMEIISKAFAAEFGGQVKVESLANFVDDGGNLLIAAGQNLGR